MLSRSSLIPTTAQVEVGACRRRVDHAACQNDITATAANPSVDLLLGINKQGIGDSISDTNHGSIIMDSERVVINAKDDFA